MLEVDIFFNSPRHPLPGSILLGVFLEGSPVVCVVLTLLQTFDPFPPGWSIVFLLDFLDPLVGLAGFELGVAVVVSQLGAFLAVVGVIGVVV